MKNFLSRFYFWRSQKDKIEDPRSAEQIGTKLVGWREQRLNTAERTFRERSAEESRFAAGNLEAQKRRIREEDWVDIPTLEELEEPVEPKENQK